MDHKKYASLSALILLITVVLAVIQYLYIEPGSIYEQAICVVATIMFSALSMINLKVSLNKELSVMERAHAITRSVMFIIGAAFGIYLGLIQG